MQNKITDIDDGYGLGYPCGRNLFKVASGPYAGRMAAMIQTGLNEVALFYADPPCSDWTGPLLIDDNIHNEGCDALIDDNGDVLIVFAEKNTGYLMFRRLTWSNGMWTVGARREIHTAGICSCPTISLEPGGRIWVAYSLYVQPNQHVHVKCSDDQGATWGSGSSDPGESLSAGYTPSYARVLATLDSTCAVCTMGNESLRFRSVPFGSDVWSEETIIAVGNGIDYNFDAAVGPDGLLGVAFDDVCLKYREYDGSNWSAVVTLDENSGFSPQLFFRGNVPVAVYLCPWIGDRGVTKYVERTRGVFSEPAILDGRARTPDSSLVYSAVSATYEEVTTAASNAIIADVFHSDTGCLLKNSGDALYVGLDSPFRFLECHLSTSGIGGTVVFRYFNGLNWVAFIPFAGNSMLDVPGNDIILWQDYSGIPADWQKCLVDGRDRFWVKLETNSAFSVGPVGDYLSTISAIQTLSFRR